METGPTSLDKYDWRLETGDWPDSARVDMVGGLMIPIVTGHTYPAKSDWSLVTRQEKWEPYLITVPYHSTALDDTRLRWAGVLPCHLPALLPFL